MNPLPWHKVEKAILQEERWLSEVFDFGPYSGNNPTSIPPNLSTDKMLRQLAISIVSGRMEAREFTNFKTNGLWSDNEFVIESTLDTEERHGGHWHQIMMGVVKDHFIKEGFEVVNEPSLGMGRADLGVYKPDYKDLYVEIGSTSLFKTWFNTQTMPSTIFLFVPTTSYAVELVTNDNQVVS